jgi:hypothetical protein
MSGIAATRPAGTGIHPVAAIRIRFRGVVTTAAIARAELPGRVAGFWQSGATIPPS